MASFLRKLGFAERGAAPGGGRAPTPVQPPLSDAQACEVRRLPDEGLYKVLPQPGARRAVHAMWRAAAKRRLWLQAARISIDVGLCCVVPCGLFGVRLSTGTARTNAAVSREKPDLPPGGRPDHTVLQQARTRTQATQASLACLRLTAARARSTWTSSTATVTASSTRATRTSASGALLRIDA